MSTPPPTSQTNPLSPVPNAVEIAGGFKVNQTWSQWLYDLREKVNVIGITIAQMGGSTTPQEAFNSISPLTTKGDLLGFSTSNDRFPVGGTDGWVLTIDHTQPFGVKWAVGGGGGDPMHVTTVTSDYTVAITDLPNASSNIGLIVANFSSPANIKIDKKANTSIPIGAHLFIAEQGVGKVTILGLPGVTFYGPTIVDGGQYSRGEIIQIEEDTWLVSGNLAFSAGVVYSSIIMGDSPLGYWRLGESTGSTAADSSGNSYNGSYVSCTQGTASLISNNLGNLAVSGNGTSSQITIGAVSELFLNNNCSIEGWCKPASVSGIYGFWSAGYQGIGLRMNNGNFELLSDYSSSLHTFIVGMTVGSIYHVVLVISSANVCTLYVNGASVGSYTKASTFTGAYVRIGADGSNSGTVGTFLTGTIDEVAVYNYMLTSTQITTHYNAGI